MAKDIYKQLGEKKGGFLRWQMRIIIVTMIGYALFLFRKKKFLFGDARVNG